MVRHWNILVLAGVVACGSGAGGGDDGGTGPTFAKDHPRIYLHANRDRLVADLATPAGMRFKAMVDSWVGGGDVYNFSSWNAALVGQLTGDAKYCTAAIASVDKTVMDAEQKISAGTAPDVAGDSYLDIGNVVGNLALVYDWCFNAIPADRKTAWLAFANQAVFNVWHPMEAAWGGKTMTWSGWAIDDPEDNYYYQFMRATAYLGLAAHDEIDSAAGWLTEFHDTKFLGELVPKFDMDLVGGASREGTGYGVAMASLFEEYDMWGASTGEDIAAKTPHTRASMLAMIHQIVPTLDRIAPTGDQSRDSTASFFDYHRSYLQKLITLFPNDPVSPRAQALLANSSLTSMSQQFMYVYDLLNENSAITATTLDGLGKSYYAPGIGELYARSGWDKHATWVNLIAGPYTQSHAHQDQGSIMIYKDGWLAFDEVIDSHSGLPQDVTAHSTMRIVDNGMTMTQKVGTSSQLLALHKGDGWLHAAADITPVYKGDVGKLQREIVYLEPDCLIVYDRAATTATQQQVWQLVMPTAPTIAGTETQVSASGHTLTVQRISPSGAAGSVFDYTTDSSGDFNNGFRLDETMAGGTNTWLHVLWIDGAVTSQMAHDANTVEVVLASGTHATVAFDPTGVGGTLTLGSTAIPLGAGVDTLPE